MPYYRWPIVAARIINQAAWISLQRQRFLKADVQSAPSNQSDREPIQSQLTQADLSPAGVSSLIDRIADVLRGQHIVRHVDIGGLPVYDLG